MSSSPSATTATSSASTGMTSTTPGMVPATTSSIVMAAVSITLTSLLLTSWVAAILGTFVILRLEPISSVVVVVLLRHLPHVVILIDVKMHRRQPIAPEASLWLDFGIAVEGRRRRTKGSVRVCCQWAAAGKLCR